MSGHPICDDIHIFVCHMASFTCCLNASSQGGSFPRVLRFRSANLMRNLLRSGTYAGINLTGYHPPPGTPGLLHRNVCPAPGLLHNRKSPGGGPKNDDVLGAGHLHQLAFKHENC